MVVVGYYGLSMKDIVRADAPSSIRRGGPLSISVVLLGRLAVDRREQGRGLGKALLKDALLRSARAARSVGARALVVDAKDEDARRFYEHYGFRRSPTAEMQLFRRLDGIVP
jgi:GNAT superfamily N-acetyltransferase